MSTKNENVEHYPRPPAIEAVTDRIRVYLEGTCIADSTSCYRVLETYHAPTYYIPAGDVSAQLIPISGGTICEFKGRSAYFDVVPKKTATRRAAWCYPAPNREYAAIKGYIAFYPGLMEKCLIGDQEVVAQPGDFYGGWVTPGLTGRIKGAPGTNHW